MHELQIEKVIITREMEARSPHYYQDLTETLNKLVPEVPVEKISHEKLKEITRETHNIVFVRTGETTPFANLILVSGVIF